MVDLTFLKEYLYLALFREFGRDSTSFLPLPETVTGEMELSILSPQSDNTKKFLVCLC